MRILVVEDEPKVAAFIEQGLRESGHDVDVANEGERGRELGLQNTYDLIMLDVILPIMNGTEVCRAIRQEKPDVPILMLSALGTVGDKVTGLDAGADDYIVKPFEFQELLARIRSLSRRTVTGAKANINLKYADIELDRSRKVAIRGGYEILLTAKEFSLLEYMMSNPERVLSRAEISEHVWDVNFDTGTNIVDVYVNILRKKVDRDFPNKLIHTRVGHGYILETER